MRKLMLILLAVVIVAGFIGCGAAPRIVNLVSTFDSDMARELSQGKGSNSIKGSALIRQSGGGVVTCAGQDVILTPVTAYASERIQAIYGSTQRGAASFGSVPNAFSPDIPEYYEFRQDRLCDAQGFFKFEEIPDGEYFITVIINWMVNNLHQGGGLMQRVEVRGGQTIEVVLAP